ncbi:MAG: hypothetical protein IPI32_02330 [Austwickia sp.]|nr:hypothetical protein [Austwickia sp.]MBK8437794.1 hypothetical protein [Austwickia sp.]MBK9100101.1 hypothetical protein [Austwickia sp.]
MTTLAESIATISSWPEVAEAMDEAREACTQLRWHQALRRRIPEAAAESRVRGAAASAELDGAPYSIDRVRDLMRGATPWPQHLDPVDATVRAAVHVTAETEHASRLLAVPGQVLARLHVAAATGLLPDDLVGRPRLDGEGCAEFGEIGPAPQGAELAARLRTVAELLALADAPALVVGALVHAEIACLRPFGRGNGLVARAVERAVVIGRGLDPTGASVPEVGHLNAGITAYVGALTGYAQGSRAGLTLWLRQSAKAIVAGAQEGHRIADAVLVGRLT